MTAMPQVPPGVQCANACPLPCSGTSCFFLSYLLSLLPLKLTVPNHDPLTPFPWKSLTAVAFSHYFTEGRRPGMMPH